MRIETVKDHTKITENFTFFELWNSSEAYKIGIDNKIRSQEVLDNLENICLNILEPLRKRLGLPVVITSGFRTELLNFKVGGSKNSQHLIGEAVDFVCENKKRAFGIIRDNFVFDQLIWEYGDDNSPDWIHVSLCRDKTKNRNQILRIHKK